MVQQPIPPTPVNPHDDDVEDDSLLRPITTPPSRDRAQAQYGDAESSDDERAEVSQAMNESGARATLMVPLAIVAIVVIALLLFWLL